MQKIALQSVKDEKSSPNEDNEQRFLLTLRVKIRVIWGNEYLFGDIPQLGQLLNELGGFVVYYTYPPPINTLIIS